MVGKLPMRPIRDGGSVFSGFAFKSKDFCDAGIPVVKIKNVKDRRVSLIDNAFFPSSKLTDKHSRFFLKDRDVLIAMTGQGSVGRVGRVRVDSNRHALLNQRVGKFVTDPDTLDLGYLFYVLSSPYYERVLFDAGYGSGQPNLSPSSICSVEIPFPDIEVQRRIAAVLGALDDKIELNLRMNQTLEEMAQAIFKSWFIDFDGVPTEDLMDGELGPIPREWTVATIGDACVQVQNGGTPKRAEPTYWEPKEVPWLTSKEVRQPFVTITDTQISRLGLAKSSAKTWTAGTTIVALYGATAGQVTMTAMDLCANQACCGLTPKPIARCFVYLGLLRSSVRLKSMSRGSAQQNLSKGLVEGFNVVLPPEDRLAEFEAAVGPLVDKAILNERESRTLADLRDTLLDKLLSGEVRLPEAERQGEAAL